MEWQDPHVAAFKRAWARADSRRGAPAGAAAPVTSSTSAPPTAYPPPLTAPLPPPVEEEGGGGPSDQLLAGVSERSAELERYLAQCDALIATLTAVVDGTGELLQKHASTVSKTQQLHARCSALLESKRKLDGIVAQITLPLAYFQSLNTMCARVGLPPDSVYFAGDGIGGDIGKSSTGNDDSSAATVLDGANATTVPTSAQLQLDDATRAKLAVSPDGPEIFDVLDRTSECLRFLRAHPTFRDARHYIAGYEQVEKRALEMIKGDVFTKLEHATSRIWPSSRIAAWTRLTRPSRQILRAWVLNPSRRANP